MNKFLVSAVELDGRLEQQSTATLAFAAVGALTASSAYAMPSDQTCGDLQDSPCGEASCSIFSW